MKTETTAKKPERQLQSMTVDELEARVEKIIECLPDGLADEWLDDLDEADLLRTKEEAVFKEAFWNAARILLRNIVAYGEL